MAKKLYETALNLNSSVHSSAEEGRYNSRTTQTFPAYLVTLQHALTCREGMRTMWVCWTEAMINEA